MRSRSITNWTRRFRSAVRTTWQFFGIGLQASGTSLGLVRILFRNLKSEERGVSNQKSEISEIVNFRLMGGTWRDAFPSAPPARRGRCADQANATLPLNRRAGGGQTPVEIVSV